MPDVIDDDLNANDDPTLNDGENADENDAELEAGADDPGPDDDGLDDPDGSSDGDGSDEVDVQPRRRGGRANETIRALRARTAEMERQIADLVAGRQQQPQHPQGETSEQRAARRALMDPLEAMRDEMAEFRENASMFMRTNAAQTQDAMDKATFDALANSDPMYRKWAPQVERELSNLRSKGQTVGRQQLLMYLIGKQVVESRNSKSGTQQRQQAAKRVAAQRTSPSNNRSDVQRGERPGGSDAARRERRLENLQL